MKPAFYEKPQIPSRGLTELKLSPDICREILFQFCSIKKVIVEIFGRSITILHSFFKKNKVTCLTRTDPGLLEGMIGVWYGQLGATLCVY